MLSPAAFTAVTMKLYVPAASPVTLKDCVVVCGSTDAAGTVTLVPLARRIAEVVLAEAL